MQKGSRSSALPPQALEVILLPSPPSVGRKAVMTVKSNTARVHC